MQIPIYCRARTPSTREAISSEGDTNKPLSDNLFFLQKTLPRLHTPLKTALGWTKVHLSLVTVASKAMSCAVP
jgi:hypothetical protein